MQMFVALSILSVGLVFLTGETDAFLPSFSYCNLADKLLKNLAAQRQLAITKEQIAGLDAMLSDTRKELSSILAEKRRKQLSTTNSSPLRSTVLLDQIKFEKNEEHKLSLGMILTEYQLDQLRPVFLKVKFKRSQYHHQRPELSYQISQMLKKFNVP